MRATSPQFQNLLRASLTVPTLVIRLTNGEIRRLARDERSIGGNLYQPLLQEISEIKRSRTGGVNRVSAVVNNINRQIGFDIVADTRRLELAEALLGRLYQDIRNETIFEHRTLFVGRVANARVGLETAEIEIISDLSAVGTIANRTLSPDCAFVYKSWRCGADSPLSKCNKQLKSEHGCAGRRNIPRHGGWTEPEYTPPPPPDGGIGDGGYELPCFVAGTKICHRDGLRNIKSIRVGDLVWSFDDISRKVSLNRVVETFEHEVNGYFKLSFDDGSNINVTPEHQFLAPSGWTTAARLRFGQEVFTFSEDYLSATKRLISAEWIREKTTVYNFEVANLHTYFAGDCAVHNRKRDPDIGYQTV